MSPPLACSCRTSRARTVTQAAISGCATTSSARPRGRTTLVCSTPRAVALVSSVTDRQIHKNTNDLQPRLGVIWNPPADGRLAVRAAYAVMINQTEHRSGRPVGANPPLATPLNVAGAVQMDSAFATARLLRPGAEHAPTRTSSRAVCRPGTSTSSGRSARRRDGRLFRLVRRSSERSRSTSISSSTACVRTRALSAASPISAGRDARQHHRTCRAPAGRTTRACGSRRTAG